MGVGGWLEQLGIKLISTQVVVEVEVGVELGNLHHIFILIYLQRRHILSAAHCFLYLQNSSAPVLNVVLLRSSQQIKTHKIEQIKNHKRFTPESKFNDIAILQLKTPIVFDSEVHP